MVAWNLTLTNLFVFQTERKARKLKLNHVCTYPRVWSAKAIFPNTARLRVAVLIERWAAPGLWMTAVHLLRVLQHLTTHVSHVFLGHTARPQVVLYVVHRRLEELLQNNATVTSVTLTWSEVSGRQLTTWRRPVYVGFEVLMAVTVENAVFWDVVPCALIINRHFAGTCRLCPHSRRNNMSKEKRYMVTNRQTDRETVSESVSQSVSKPASQPVSKLVS
jgi:hypothetical protein